MQYIKIFSDDYLTKTRGYIELTWEEKREELLPVLRNIILNQKDEEWRLRALEVLACWQASEEISELQKLYEDWDPTVLRGFMWFIISVGDPTDILKMLEFAASPKGRIINPETVLNLLTQAIQKNRIDASQIYQFALDKLNILRYISGWDFSDDTPRLLTIYPSADYLALKCRAREIPFKQYKKIHYKNYKM